MPGVVGRSWIQFTILVCVKFSTLTDFAEVGKLCNKSLHSKGNLFHYFNAFLLFLAAKNTLLCPINSWSRFAIQ